MKRLFLPILILSFSFASAQEISSDQIKIDANKNEVTITFNEQLNDGNDLEVAYKSKALRDPDNIDFDNIYKEKQLELFVTEGDKTIC